MAYTGFPATYPQTYPQSYPQYQQQNNGFIRVQSENEARMYPVAPGNSIIFIDANAPYCYTKTADISQLDRPKFEKYRLVKEPCDEKTKKNETECYATIESINKLQEEIENIKKALFHKDDES